MPTAAYPLTITLFALMATSAAQAQTTSQVFHFAHTSTEQAANEIATSIRVIGDTKDASVDFPARTLTVNGTADQLKLAEWMFVGMDRTVPIPADSNVHEYLMPSGTDNVVRLFYIDSGQTVQEFQEFATMLRTIAEIRRVFTYNAGKILAMRGTADQMGMADYFTNQLAKTAPAPRPHSVTPAYLGEPVVTHNMVENVTNIFFVANAATTQDFQELATLIRTISGLRRVFIYNTPRAIAVRGTSDQVALAEWLFNQIDQPGHGGSSHASAIYTFQDPEPVPSVAYAATKVQVFYLPNTASVQDFQKVATNIRTTAQISRVFTYNSPRALAIRGTLDQIEQAEQLLTELDPADFPKAP
jgi:hypothetical protein